MKVTYEGKVCEVRETLLGGFVSEIRFTPDGDDAVSIRLPQELVFKEPVRITIETVGAVSEVGDSYETYQHIKDRPLSA